MQSFSKLLHRLYNFCEQNNVWHFLNLQHFTHFIGIGIVDEIVLVKIQLQHYKLQILYKSSHM